MIGRRTNVRAQTHGPRSCDWWRARARPYNGLVGTPTRRRPMRTRDSELELELEEELEGEEELEYEEEGEEELEGEQELEYEGEGESELEEEQLFGTIARGIGSILGASEFEEEAEL